MRSARSSKEEKRKPNLQDIDAFQYPAPANKVIFRPISCYTASRISEVVEDISLDEKLVRCDYQDDVCFGKVGSVLHKLSQIQNVTLQVVLTVSNTSSTSQGILEVSKGCGKRMVLEASYKSKATYNAARQCYVTNVVKNNRVVNNNFADSVNGSVPVLSDTTSATTSTSTQVS